MFLNSYLVCVKKKKICQLSIQKAALVLAFKALIQNTYYKEQGHYLLHSVTKILLFP